MWRDPSRVKTFSLGSNRWGTNLDNIPVFPPMPLVIWLLYFKHGRPLPEWVFNFETISLYRNGQSNHQSFQSFSGPNIGFLFSFILHAFVCLLVCLLFCNNNPCHWCILKPWSPENQKLNPNMVLKNNITFSDQVSPSSWFPIHEIQTCFSVLWSLVWSKIN